jgi:hypothetical protein
MLAHTTTPLLHFPHHCTAAPIRSTLCFHPGCDCATHLLPTHVASVAVSQQRTACLASSPPPWLSTVSSHCLQHVFTHSALWALCPGARTMAIPGDLGNHSVCSASVRHRFLDNDVPRLPVLIRDEAALEGDKATGSDSDTAKGMLNPTMSIAIANTMSRARSRAPCLPAETCPGRVEKTGTPSSRMRPLQGDALDQCMTRRKEGTGDAAWCDSGGRISL